MFVEAVGGTTAWEVVRHVVDKERNLLIRVGATCRILLGDIEQLPEEIISEAFVGELQDVCTRTAERLDALAAEQR